MTQPGLPTLVMRDNGGGEVALGPGDLAARGGALLRRCDGDDSPEGMAALEAAARAGFGIALR